MFKATRPFNDKVTNYPKEPSLRIGRCVPKNAVNLAYYYNPIATDAERIIAAEAPRQTIDHRVEEAYRYLFNQSSDDDDLFPSFVWYEDEEGYQGRLGRMYVHWYPESHISTKNVQKTVQQIVVDKSNVQKMIDYKDNNGFEGNLYLDSVDYTVSKTHDESVQQELDRKVFNHELNYHEIFKTYLSPSDVDRWCEEPTNGQSQWPSSIMINFNNQIAVGGASSVSTFISNQVNPYDGAIGTLEFKAIEYEPVFDGEVSNTPTSSSGSWNNINSEFIFDGNMSSNIDIKFKKQYKTNTTGSTPNYSEIQSFLTMASSNSTGFSSTSAKSLIESAIADGNKNITIFLISAEEYVDDPSDEASPMHVRCKYTYMIGDIINTNSTEQQLKYNVIAIYGGTLKKKVITNKQVPAEYIANAHYVGIVNKIWYDYDGVAYYRGSVTKGSAAGNINPDDNNEILMYPDSNGYLRVPRIDKDGNLRNFYKVEADYVYITDVFKDGVACFYKYPLKKPIYDYRGPDSQGFYEGDAVKIFTSSLKNIPDDYKYSMKLHVDGEEEITELINNNGVFETQTKKVPKKYSGELYTSFISSSTDTFKVIYNAFDDNEENNIALENGVEEEIYNYPFMNKDIDFKMEPFYKNASKKIRANKIKINNPNIIKDTRRYITFKYIIKAIRKESEKYSAATLVSEERTASILNKDYVLNCEYNNFIERAMIISPTINGIKVSPFDLLMHDQSTRQEEPVLKSENINEFIFSAEITEIDDLNRGAVNIYCNADGSGLLAAETTIDTGFFDENLGTYTKKLSFGNPYLIENGNIYSGYKVKCVDSRYIKVMAPREENLLDSWYPRIQFGHYTQVFDQYGAHTKVCYSMPEYDKQHYSERFGQPYVEIKKEPVKIINSHMVRTKCYPLYIPDINLDNNTVKFKNKYYRIFKEQVSWKNAQLKCEKLGGNLAMPKTAELSELINELAIRYSLKGVWLGGTDEKQEGVWKWVDGTTMTYTNWNNGEPNNVGGKEHYLEVYSPPINIAGKWNDLDGTVNGSVNGYICEFNKPFTIKLYKKIDDELFEIKIRDVSFSDGIIVTEEAISENDNIICDYVYVEESYVYRGFWRTKTEFGRLDVNPNKYHTYSDLNFVPSETRPTKNLFNKVIYFFMKPSVIYEVDESEDDLIYDNKNANLGKIISSNEDTLYHQIDNPIPEERADIYIGSIYIRQNTSLHSTILVDSRTRGGGILESMPDSLRHELEPESDYYLDIGYYDGQPYQENGIIVVRLDNRLLKAYGGKFTQGDIESKVKRWLGVGVYPIIEYVNSYTKYDMPQHNLIVEDSYSNIIDETPQIYLEYVKTNASLPISPGPIV